MNDFQRIASRRPARTPAEIPSVGAMRTGFGCVIKLHVDATWRSLKNLGRPCWWVQVSALGLLDGRPQQISRLDRKERIRLVQIAKRELDGLGDPNFLHVDVVYRGEFVTNIERPCSDEELRKMELSGMAGAIKPHGTWNEHAKPYNPFDEDDSEDDPVELTPEMVEWAKQQGLICSQCGEGRKRCKCNVIDITPEDER